MHPCFLCSQPATSFRSLTQLTAAPAGPHDAVPICAACQDDWSFSLLGITRIDLAGLTLLAKPKSASPPPNPRHNNKPNCSGGL